VDVGVGDNGQILMSRTVRPMTVGTRSIMTPWSATSTDFREVEGLRVPWHLEASWSPPSDAFTYITMKSPRLPLSDKAAEAAIFP
jgi:hypothetical protein